MESRRTVLLAVGTTIGLAGCSDLADSGLGGSAGANAESDLGEGIRLGDVLLQGTDGEATHNVQIAVEDETGVVHLDTYAVEPGEPAVHVDREWDDIHTAYKINVRVDGQQRQTVDVIEQTGRADECADILLLFDADGTVSVWDRSCPESTTNEEQPEDETGEETEEDEDEEQAEDADESEDSE